MNSKTGILLSTIATMVLGIGIRHGSQANLPAELYNKKQGANSIAGKKEFKVKNAGYPLPHAAPARNQDRWFIDNITEYLSAGRLGSYYDDPSIPLSFLTKYPNTGAYYSYISGLGNSMELDKSSLYPIPDSISKKGKFFMSGKNVDIKFEAWYKNGEGGGNIYIEPAGPGSLFTDIDFPNEKISYSIWLNYLMGNRQITYLNMKLEFSRKPNGHFSVLTGYWMSLDRDSLSVSGMIVCGSSCDYILSEGKMIDRLPKPESLKIDIMALNPLFAKIINAVEAK